MPRNRPTSRGGVRCRRSLLDVEPLEPRLVAAGDVTARLVGPTLLLLGDGAANEINVASVAGGGIAVLGAATTINGSTAPFVSTAPARNIVANLGGGDDVVAFSNNSWGVARLLAFLHGSPFSPENPVVPQEAIDSVSGGASVFTLTGSIMLATGAGNDTVGIVGDVGGNVTASLGPAASTVARNGNLFGIGWNEDRVRSQLVQSRVGGSLVVTGGAQADGFGAYAVHVGRSVVVTLGGGGSTFDFIFGTIDGNVTMTGGEDSDLLLMGSSVVRGAVSIAVGGGGDDVLISDRTSFVRTVVGSISIATGAGTDNVIVGDIDVRHDARIATGPGTDMVRAGVGLGIVTGGTLVVLGGSDDDMLSVKADVGGGLWISAGSGDDLLGIFGSTVRGAMVIDACAGDDTVGIDHVEVGGTLTCRLGGGNDSLALRRVRALAIWLYGGTGMNALTIDAAAPRGVRWFQFQAVTG